MFLIARDFLKDSRKPVEDRAGLDTFSGSPATLSNYFFLKKWHLRGPRASFKKLTAGHHDLSRKFGEETGGTEPQFGWLPAPLGDSGELKAVWKTTRQTLYSKEEKSLAEAP